MGKYLIIKDADFSNVAVDTIAIGVTTVNVSNEQFIESTGYYNTYGMFIETTFTLGVLVDVPNEIIRTGTIIIGYNLTDILAPIMAYNSDFSTMCKRVISPTGSDDYDNMTEQSDGSWIYEFTEDITSTYIQVAATNTDVTNGCYYIIKFVD